jgi:hypothetical protein
MSGSNDENIVPFMRNGVVALEQIEQISFLGWLAG